VALMFPQENKTFHTEGEKHFYTFLEKVAKPDTDYIAWYTPNINDNEPDFLLYVHNLGLIVFEVKDWALDQIQEINPKQFKLTLGARTEWKQNPYEQAKDYFGPIVEKIVQDGQLTSTHPDHYGKPKVPVSYGVVFPNISKYEYVEKGFNDVLGTEKIFFWDDLHPESDLCRDATGRCLREALEERFPPRFPCNLTARELSHLRYLIFPEIKIELPERATSQEYVAQREKLRMLDHHQEAIARKYDGGHNIIIGPSGSGKTIILVHRAAFLRKYNPAMQNILFVCYNITLVNYIKRMLSDKKIPLGANGVEVMHFFELCAKLLNENIHYEREDQKYYETVIGLALDKVKNIDLQYDAILIDEGQDFSEDMFRIAAALLNRKTDSLTIALDEKQNIYHPKLSWRKLGIAAKGRVRRLNNVYRNTAEISRFAARFMNLDGQPPEKEKTGEAGLFDNFFEFHGPEPQLAHFPDMDSLASFVAERIKDLHEKDGYPFSEIAILYTIRFYNKEKDTTIPQLFTETLESKGIMSNWVSESYHAKKSYDITTNSVTISTIHSAKGLDYACVFLVGLDLLEPGEKWSEEAIHSLTYVGITRARYNLFIPYIEKTAYINALLSCL